MLIETDRLILREFAPDDWRAVYSYQNDLRYLEWYEWTHRTELQVKTFVQTFVEQQQEIPRVKFQLAVTLRENDKLIGNVGIRKQDAHALVAELGYEIDPRQWNNGYATEAARAMLKFAFQELQLHRVWARSLANNLAAAHVMEKLGMRQEGHLRENEYFKGRWWDTLLYGILEDEWRWQLANSG